MGLKEKGWPKTKFEGESKRGGHARNRGYSTSFSVGLKAIVPEAGPMYFTSFLFRVVLVLFHN